MPEGSGRFARLLEGLALPLRALRLLAASRGLKRVAILPLLANLLVYAFAIVLCLWLVRGWDFEVGPWDFWGGFGAWLAGLLNACFGALKWMIAIPLLLLASYFSFTAVGMLVASPFNEVLSERVEAVLRQQEGAATLGWRLRIRSLLRGLADALVTVSRQLFFTLLALPLLLLPVVGWLPLLLICAYFSGLGYLDCALGRNHLRGTHRRAFLRERRWELLGLGLAMELLFLVPLVGLVLLPLGVTAGTILYCGCDRERLFKKHGLRCPEG